MCRDCVLSFGFSKQSNAASAAAGIGRCMKCDVEVKRNNKDMIELKESGSAFSGHS
jgi:Na+-transporting NADH:ubiquinone oxidoreductase subunit NqrF